MCCFREGKPLKAWSNDSCFPIVYTVVVCAHTVVFGSTLWLFSCVVLYWENPYKLDPESCFQVVFIVVVDAKTVFV